MNFKTLLLSFLLASNVICSMNAQMITGTDTLYGNEWIDYTQLYFEIKIAEDGMYRLSYTDLNNGGVFSGSAIPQGQNFQLYKNGQSIPLYISET